MFVIQKKVVIASSLAVLALILGATINHKRTGHWYALTKSSVADPVAAKKAEGEDAAKKAEAKKAATKDEAKKAEGEDAATKDEAKKVASEDEAEEAASEEEAKEAASEDEAKKTPVVAKRAVLHKRGRRVIAS